MDDLQLVGQMPGWRDALGPFGGALDCVDDRGGGGSIPGASAAVAPKTTSTSWFSRTVAAAAAW